MSDLYTAKSAIAGLGCYAARDFKEGETVGQYIGDHISGDEADERYADAEMFYIFMLEDGTCIDPDEIPEKYMNHSCEPNCETEEDEGKIFIKALRDIKKDEEIVYDYCVVADDDEDLTCHCGTKSCRGTMRAAKE